MHKTVATELDAQAVRTLLLGICDLVKGDLATILEARYEISWKRDGSPVTRSDKYVEEQIRKFVSSRIPEVTFVGEETYASQTISNDAVVTILDPIDGTENFCSGLKEWGISCTIWRSGVHLGSLLYMPELDERLVTGDNLDLIRSRIRGFSSSMCQGIRDELQDGVEARIMGCAVYNLYNVIRGAFARFTNPRGAYSWDLLPGIQLALEHNCEIEVDGKQYDGQFLEPTRKYRVDVRHRYDLHPR